MNTLKAAIVLAAYLMACGISYGGPCDDCAELLPGEIESVLPICSHRCFVPIDFSCTTDTDCYNKCMKLANAGVVYKEVCE